MLYTRKKYWIRTEIAMGLNRTKETNPDLTGTISRLKRGALHMLQRRRSI
jgi:hypothetical protein